MSLGLQLFGILCGVALIAMTFRAMFKQDLTERQSLFWLFTGLVIMVVCAFPGLAVGIAGFFGVEYAPSIIFMVVLILVIFGLFYCYSKIAKLSSRNTDLAILVSMINTENREMRKQLMEMRQQAEACGQNDTKEQ